MLGLKPQILQLVVFPLIMLLPCSVLLLLHLKDFGERGFLKVRRQVILPVEVLDPTISIAHCGETAETAYNLSQ